MPPKWVSSPTLMENQRHIVGPPQRRGPQERSRLPWAPRHSEDGSVHGEGSAPAARLLEVALADGARRVRGLGRLRAAAALTVGADRRGDGVETHVEDDRGPCAVGSLGPVGVGARRTQMRMHRLRRWP